jgi:hypothetical protein
MLNDSRITALLAAGSGYVSRGRSWARAACALVALASMPTHAAYNANIVGNVTQILTYNTGLVMFSLDNQPTSNGSCTASLFELDLGNTSGDAALDRMYARLLEAQALGQPVNIGFDNAANCGAAGYIAVYRIG